MPPPEMPSENSPISGPFRLGDSARERNIGQYCPIRRGTARMTNTAALKPLVVRRRAAAPMIGCGVTKLDGLIAAGTIPAKKSGKHLVIEVAELERYIASLPAAKLKPSVAALRKSVEDIQPPQNRLAGAIARARDRLRER
jgi:hypothetical protein